jgi:hypothetical protein
MQYIQLASKTVYQEFGIFFYMWFPVDYDTS